MSTDTGRLDWPDFEGRLAASLLGLPMRSYLILERTIEGQSHFVQFAREEAGLLEEAVSNLYLTGAAALPAGSDEVLLALGWERPIPSDKNRRNWRRRWPAEEPVPVPAAAAAALAVRTLREVYGIASPSDLRYKRFHRDGADLPDPGLGIELIAPEPARVAPRYAGPRRSSRIPKLVLDVVTTLDPAAAMETLDPASWSMTLQGQTLWVCQIERPTLSLVRIHAQVLTGVAPSLALLEAINTVNTRLLQGRVLWIEGTVLFSVELPGPGLAPDVLAFTCGTVATMAPFLARELATALAGPIVDNGRLN